MFVDHATIGVEYRDGRSRLVLIAGRIGIKAPGSALDPPARNCGHPPLRTGGGLPLYSQAADPGRDRTTHNSKRFA